MQRVLPEFDPQNRLIKFLGAANPKAWPKAESQYLCIFEAVNTVGAALFGPNWTHDELGSVRWLERPQKAIAAPLKLKPNSAAFNRPGASTSAKNFLPPERYMQHDAHVADWRLASRQRAWDENQTSVSRLMEAADWLAQRCRDGELCSFARLKAGGKLYPIAAWEWNVENALASFVSDGGPKRHFPEFNYPHKLEAYLFFKRAELESNLEQRALVPLEVSKVDLARLSPFLQLAVRLAMRHGYFSIKSCETLAIREAEVRAEWPNSMDGIPITDNAVKLVARTMGFPDPVAIKRGKQGGRGKSG